MKTEGGCYCGAIRFELEGDAVVKCQCHCRECQHLSGGGVNHVLGIPEPGFRYVKGTPATFTRPDLDSPVTREFCGTCGTHLLARVPSIPGVLMLKAGTLDDMSFYGAPEMAIFTVDKQPFHSIPEGIPTFERAPG